jgi:2,4-dienoyl-CoA reductase-like NADH-dependent reductase (Old Yellow Enzyme family)
MMEVNDLTIEDIRTIQADYIMAAKKIAFAGFDGIELCIGNNFYLSRVMNPFENTRSDEYGGSTSNRVRMVSEIIKLIKKTADLHIHCKVNLYQDEEDSLEICKILDESGADSLQITKFLSPQYFRKGQSNTAWGSPRKMRPVTGTIRMPCSLARCSVARLRSVSRLSVVSSVPSRSRAMSRMSLIIMRIRSF